MIDQPQNATNATSWECLFENEAGYIESQEEMMFMAQVDNITRSYENQWLLDSECNNHM